MRIKALELTANSSVHSGRGSILAAALVASTVPVSAVGGSSAPIRWAALRPTCQEVRR